MMARRVLVRSPRYYSRPKYARPLWSCRGVANERVIICRLCVTLILCLIIAAILPDINWEGIKLI